MKKFIYASILPIALSGCLASGSGVRVNTAIDNIRNGSMSSVSDMASHVSVFMEKGTQDKAIEAAKSSVADSLRDPPSAQFRGVRMVTYLHGKVVCGEVNGKNAYGGYVGYRPFVSGTSTSTIFDADNEYPAIQSAANAGLTAACGY